jgi:hypothetical protein
MIPIRSTRTPLSASRPPASWGTIMTMRTLEELGFLHEKRGKKEGQPPYSSPLRPARSGASFQTARMRCMASFSFGRAVAYEIRIHPGA